VQFFRAAVLVPVLAVLLGAGQDGSATKSESSQGFFSGTVEDLSPERVTVQRHSMGKSGEKRTFLITNDTRIEGRLRRSARVTVGFVPIEEEPLATRIIVRGETAER
jgi:hypothetical protein